MEKEGLLQHRTQICAGDQPCIACQPAGLDVRLRLDVGGLAGGKLLLSRYNGTVFSGISFDAMKLDKYIQEMKAGIPENYAKRCAIKDDEDLDAYFKDLKQEFANDGFKGVVPPESSERKIEKENESIAKMISDGTKTIVESNKN